MPYCALTTHSTLLTTDGWTRTDRCAASLEVMGVDRHGVFDARQAGIELSDKATGIAYVGTRSAFGAFHARTTLVDANGVLRNAQAIVTAEKLEGIHFERGGGLNAAEKPASNLMCERLWNELSQLAFASSQDELTFRALRKETATNPPPPWLELVEDQKPCNCAPYSNKFLCPNQSPWPASARRSIIDNTFSRDRLHRA